VFAESGLTKEQVALAITLAAQDNMDSARSILMGDGDSAPAAVEPSPCLGLSESEFLALTSAEQASMRKQIETAGRAARALGRDVVAHIAQALEEGNQDKASQWAARVNAMGVWLSSAEQTQLLRLFGDGVLKDLNQSNVGG
jgi:hypothetical protein